MLIIHAMFGIRLRLWDGEVLNAQDQRLWGFYYSIRNTGLGFISAPQLE